MRPLGLIVSVLFCLLGSQLLWQIPYLSAQSSCWKVRGAKIRVLDSFTDNDGQWVKIAWKSTIENECVAPVCLTVFARFLDQNHVEISRDIKTLPIPALTREPVQEAITIERQIFKDIRYLKIRTESTLPSPDCGGEDLYGNRQQQEP
jgi:hypothetical protein